LCLSGFNINLIDYGKVASSSMSCLEAHVEFFRLLMKGIFDLYMHGIV
jgi:hypothetical protein